MFQILTDNTEDDQIVFSFLSGYPDILGTVIHLDSTARVGSKRRISSVLGSRTTAASVTLVASNLPHNIN